jgi:hypothetical protein
MRVGYVPPACGGYDISTLKTGCVSDGSKGGKIV